MRLGMNRRFLRRRILFIVFSIFILLLLILAGLVCIYITGLESVFPVYAEKYAECITEKAVSETSDEIFQNTEELHKMQTGDISFLISDIQKMNSVKSQVNQMISEKIEADRTGIKIPLGSLSGIRLFSGTGPEIPVYAKPVVITTSEFKDEFISGGINQTKYRVYLDVNVDITFMNSGNGYNKKIKDSVLISETVIIGNVPDIYSEKYNEQQGNTGK